MTTVGGIGADTRRFSTTGSTVSVGCFQCRARPKLLFTYLSGDISGGWFCNVDHAERWHGLRFPRPIRALGVLAA